MVLVITDILFRPLPGSVVQVDFCQARQATLQGIENVYRSGKTHQHMPGVQAHR